MKRIFRSALMACAFAGASAGVHAAELACSGTVTALSYHSPNNFMIQLSSMNAPVFFCSPDTNWTVPGTTYTTGVSTCKQMYATFLMAKAQGLPVNSVYFDGNDVPAACNAWGNWKSANIRFFSM